MLLCSARIPVVKEFTAPTFVALAIEWIEGSRNYCFDAFTWDGSAEFTRTGKNAELFQVGHFEDQKICAVHFRATDNRSIVGLSNILYSERFKESSKFFFRREPGKRAHR